MHYKYCSQTSNIVVLQDKVDDLESTKHTWKQAITYVGQC